MKTEIYKAIQLLKLICITSIFILLFMRCSKEAGSNQITQNSSTKAFANPSWKADARCFLDGAFGTFDDIAVKDPSIVYSGGKWHLFYTGRDKGIGGNWRMG